MERLGIVDELQANTAALIESARKRGMSASAIARLPRPARETKPDALPKPVLAAAAEHYPERRAHMVAYRARTDTGVKQPKKKREARRINVGPGRPHVTGDDYTLFRRIVDLAATASGVPEGQIRDFIRDRHVVPVRHICWRLMREFSGLGTTGIAQIAGRACHTSVLQGISRALGYEEMPDRVALYWEVRTRLSAAGHRIVVDLGERKRGSRP